MCSNIIILNYSKTEISEILIERLTFRINRIHKPDLVILIDKEGFISKNIITLLDNLNSSFTIVESFKDFDIPILESYNIPLITDEPFNYLQIVNKKEIFIHSLAMDRELNLVDNHIHTQFAYCNYNMDVEKSIKLGKLFGLGGMTITEHSGQLYYDINEYNKVDSYITGINSRNPKNNRMLRYLDFKNKYSSDFVKFSVELDFDFNGEPIIIEDDLKNFDFILGTMHQLPDINAENFLKLLEKILIFGVDAIAHPFRIFKRNGKELPLSLFKPVAKLLKKYNTAAEINFHSNEPPVDFIRECLSIGVKFSFGSDSHNLAKLGDFSYHINLLKEAGFKGDLKDVLIP